jgi:hypothetical protein
VRQSPGRAHADIEHPREEKEKEKKKKKKKKKKKPEVAGNAGTRNIDRTS